MLCDLAIAQLEFDLLKLKSFAIVLLYVYTTLMLNVFIRCKAIRKLSKPGQIYDSTKSRVSVYLVWVVHRTYAWID